MRTLSRSRITSALASLSEMSLWILKTSAIWLPIGKIGLSEVIGSWKIIAISLPRTRRISSSGSVSNSRPASRTLPSTRLELAGRSPMIERAVTLFPEPDSPTMATVSRGAISKERLRTTGFQPLPSLKEAVRSRTQSSGGAAPPLSSMAMPERNIPNSPPHRHLRGAHRTPVMMDIATPRPYSASFIFPIAAAQIRIRFFSSGRTFSRNDYRARPLYGCLGAPPSPALLSFQTHSSVPLEEMELAPLPWNRVSSLLGVAIGQHRTWPAVPHIADL